MYLHLGCLSHPLALLLSFPQHACNYLEDLLDIQVLLRRALQKLPLAALGQVATDFVLGNTPPRYSQVHLVPDQYDA